MADNFVTMQIKLLREYVLLLTRTHVHVDAHEMEMMSEQVNMCEDFANMMAPGRDREEMTFLLAVLTQIIP